MKKLIVLIILFSTQTALRAQETGRFGVGAGVDVSKMILSHQIISVDETPMARFKGYIFYDMPLGKGFSLQNELGYDGMGFKYIDLPGNPNRYSETYDYVTLSVLPAYNLHQTGLSFFIGPSLGYLFHANSTGGGHNISSTADFSSFDLLGVVGEEYFFPNGIGITFRYMYGFIDIAKGYTYGGDAHNNVFSFTVAYKFKTGMRD